MNWLRHVSSYFFCIWYFAIGFRNKRSCWPFSFRFLVRPVKPEVHIWISGFSVDMIERNNKWVVSTMALTKGNFLYIWVKFYLDMQQIDIAFTSVYLKHRNLFLFLTTVISLRERGWELWAFPDLLKTPMDDSETPKFFTTESLWNSSKIWYGRPWNSRNVSLLEFQ